ncbi:MAG: hypothetical protein CMO74_09825 [Verrucomicrobiales bacterium]|nr:hypothetical protein [Verrucomicrobiales bacterium]|tara:strand:+ start:5581 stop:6441 length:861 start_codon:yes stop_codon:yes gene_type:complete
MPWRGPKEKPSPAVAGNPLAVSLQQVEQRANGLWFLKDAERPYTGRVEQRYANGQMAAVVTLLDGQQDGLYELWYASGQKQLEVTFSEDRMHGTGREWYENGNLRREIFYSEGRRRGLKEWYADGIQKKLLDWDADGMPRGVTAPGNNATRPVLPPPSGVVPVAPPPAAPGLKVREVFYGEVIFRGPDGSPISGAFGPDTFVFVKGEDKPYTGRVVDKFPNGNLREEMHVVEGRPHGTWTEWYANEKKQLEILYESGEVRRLRIWDPSGKLIERGQGKGNGIGPRP